MGCVNSKEQENEIASDTSSDKNDFQIKSRSKKEEEMANRLKRDLKQFPQQFVVNNMLLCILFFVNYAEEIQRLKESTVTNLEKQFNQNLLEKENVECLTPDILMDVVNVNVRYRPHHGPNKEKSEPIQSKRIFIINDIIDVINPTEESVEYVTIDNPRYQVTVKNSERKGYVKLKLNIDKNNPPPYDTESTKTPIFAYAPERVASSSDSEAYEAIDHVKTPTLINIDHSKRRNSLPESCFKVRLEKDLNSVQDCEKQEDLFEKTFYMSSTGYMDYYQGIKFPNFLAEELSFQENEIKSARKAPGYIICNKDEGSQTTRYEIVPCVKIPFPSEEKEVFKNRDRPQVIEKKTGRRHKWPGENMINEITSIKCVAIPRGFHQKKGKNKDYDIEWEIQFPQAEKYLLTKMTHVQFRCYIILLAIHKMLIEPITKEYGLLPEHIRNHMFWECEENAYYWPENEMGTKMHQIIENLNKKLSIAEMNCFFIDQKNMFENIPKKYLLAAQTVFHNLLQRPAMSFIRVLRNLRYTTGKFYPTLDYKELHKILISKGNTMHSTPHIQNFVSQRREQPKQASNLSAEQLWNQKQIEIQRNRYLKTKQEKENLQKYDERKESVDSIKIDWECEKEFEPIKFIPLLKLFIETFIEIHKYSRKIAPVHQSEFYLKRAGLLTTLLGKSAEGAQENVQEYKKIIRKETEEWYKEKESKHKDIPPSTPARNHTFTFEHLLTKNSSIHLTNLNSSYTNGLQSTSNNVINKKNTVKGIKNQNSNPESPSSPNKKTTFDLP